MIKAVAICLVVFSFEMVAENYFGKQFMEENRTVKRAACVVLGISVYVALTFLH
jgi:hypothetical protein